jgi:hypothetical protein
MNAKSNLPVRKVRAVMVTGGSLTGLAAVMVWLFSMYNIEIPSEVAIFLAVTLTSLGTSLAGYLTRADLSEYITPDRSLPDATN